MEAIASLVAQLESRGVEFHQNPSRVNFSVRDTRDLLPEDTNRIGELILEREDELRSYLENRGATFGAFAGVFRSFACRIQTPAGMMPWLRERAPRLYADITGRLPDRIQSLWEQGASIEEFKRAIVGLEEAQSCARSFYEECRKGNEDG